MGGEALIRQVPGGAPEPQREGDRLPHRGLCHHAAGVRHAGGGRGRALISTEASSKRRERRGGFKAGGVVSGMWKKLRASPAVWGGGLCRLTPTSPQSLLHYFFY